MTNVQSASSAISIQSLLSRVQEASFNAQSWASLTEGMAEWVGEGFCRIAFHPHASRAPEIRLNGVSSRVDRGMERMGPGRHAAASDPKGAGVSQASLVLAELAGGVWKIEFCSKPQAAPSHLPQMLLSHLGSTLTASFQVLLALQGEGRLEAARLRDLWDPLPFGVMLLDPGLRLRFANVAADDLLGTRSLFRPFGREGCVRPTLQKNFAALTQACEMLRDGAGESASFDMLDRFDGAFGEITVISFAKRAGLSPRGARNEGASGCVALILRPFAETLGATQEGAAALAPLTFGRIASLEGAIARRSISKA